MHCKMYEVETEEEGAGRVRGGAIGHFQDPTAPEEPTVAPTSHGDEITRDVRRRGT